MRTGAADRRLQVEVLDALFQEASIDATEFGVIAERGIVTLSGRVFNDQERQTAEAAALTVPGVGAVVDELVVRPPGCVDDDVLIARAARDALDWAAGVPDDRIKVVVYHGRVRLEGIVGRSDERNSAEAAVRGVLGQAVVENAIVVYLWPGLAGSGNAPAPITRPERAAIALDRFDHRSPLSAAAIP